MNNESLALELSSFLILSVSEVSLHSELGLKTHGALRKFILARFPYVVYYSIMDDHVQVIACLYGGQKPQETENALKERS
jgi:hypothetical protein